jgi:fumarylacetoacetate (FAA) hydrolase
MKIVSYHINNEAKGGLLVNDKVIAFKDIDVNLPSQVHELLQDWSIHYNTLLQLSNTTINELAQQKGIAIQHVNLLAPITKATSCRDGYAFRQHVAAARRNRGVPMIPEFDQYPIFYFTNHNAITGPGNIYCMPDHFKKLDFELEVAIVIGKQGRNIKAKDADSYIAGLTIMNDMSARTLQMEEMLLNLGPAKGKDFSTTIGPWLVTLDELKNYETSCKPNHTGTSWNLTMTCFVNNKQVSLGNVADMDWTFAEIIERASYGADVFPGDIIGSGTVGTGCFLELNGTGKLENPNYIEQWLQPNDIVRMEIDALGILENTIIAEDTDWSILQQKKV